MGGEALGLSQGLHNQKLSGTLETAVWLSRFLLCPSPFVLLGLA
jgi:hypothetical protein